MASINLMVILSVFFTIHRRLLYWGTLRFGIGNWQTIQQELFPGKSPLQVKTLYKNLQSSRVPDNPMKELSRYLKRPLNDRENAILRDAVEHYGPQFDAISMFFLPHRTPITLRKAWYELEKKDQRYLFPTNDLALSSSIIESHYPVDDDSSASTPPSTIDHRLVVHSDPPYPVAFQTPSSPISHTAHYSSLPRQDTLVLSPQKYDLASPVKRKSLDLNRPSLIRVHYYPSTNRDMSHHPVENSDSSSILIDPSSSLLSASRTSDPSATQPPPQLPPLALHDWSTVYPQHINATSLATPSSSVVPTLLPPTNNLSLLLDDSTISLDLSISQEPPPLSATEDYRPDEMRMDDLPQSPSSICPLTVQTSPPPPSPVHLSSLPPQNHLTLDNGLTYVNFSREEDRHILMTALVHGDDCEHIWSSSIETGNDIFSPDKSLEHIMTRYRQLRAWMNIGFS
jgi:hypothetical protein